MGRHDGTRIGMGGTLLGLGGAGTLALLIYADEVAVDGERASAWSQAWFIAVFAVAALMAAGGMYFLAAVWFGWPIGSTAIERAFQPRLVDTRADAHLPVPQDYVVVKIGTFNAGRGDIHGAMLNVLVPEFITEIERCDERGAIGHPHHMGGVSHSSKALILCQPDLGSIYWNGNVSFPGRMARIVFFRLRMPGMRHDFRLRLRIGSPELERPFDDQFHIRASSLRA